MFWVPSYAAVLWSEHFRPRQQQQLCSEMSDFFSQIATGAVESGVNYPTFIAINFVLFGVILSLILFLAAAASSPAHNWLVVHIIVLIFLAICLWGALIYVLGLTGIVEGDQQQQEGKQEEAAEEEEPAQQQQQQEQQRQARRRKA
jgi:type VI protein secretion system component VasK